MSFGYYRDITIDHTQCGSADSANFPVAVFGTYAHMKSVGNGGRIANGSANDNVYGPNADGSSPYSFEQVYHNLVTGEIEYHVKVPTLSHTADTVIKNAYGDSGVTTFQGGSAGAAWDSNFKGVYHFGDGSTLGLGDSTSNANDLTNHSATATAGEVGGAAAFVSGSSQYMSSPATLGAGDFTAGGWLKADSGGTQVLFASYDGSSLTSEFWLGVSGGNLIAVFGGNAVTTSSAIGGDGSMHFVVIRRSGSTCSLWLDTGAIGGTVSDSGDKSRASTLGRFDAQAFYWDGKADEWRAAQAYRSDSWLTQTYNNQKPSQTFYSVGTEQTNSSGAVGTLAKTLGALTSAAAGTVKVAGALAKTLGALTVAGTGTCRTNLTLSRTLGAASVSATGTVRTNLTLSRTLGSLSCSADGTVKTHGALAKTLGSLTVVATGRVLNTGSLARTLGALTLVATGGGNVLNRTLGALTVAGTGTVKVKGALACTLGDARSYTPSTWRVVFIMKL